MTTLSSNTGQVAVPLGRISRRMVWPYMTGLVSVDDLKKKRKKSMEPNRLITMARFRGNL